MTMGWYFKTVNIKKERKPMKLEAFTDDHDTAYYLDNELIVASDDEGYAIAELMKWFDVAYNGLVRNAFQVEDGEWPKTLDELKTLLGK